MDLKQLEKGLRGALSGGKLSLSNLPVDPAILSRVISILPASQVTLGNVTVNLEQKASPPRLVVSGECEGAWEIPGIAGTGLKGIALSLSFTEPKHATELQVDCDLKATLSLAAKEVPVTGQTTGLESWTLTMNTSALTLADFLTPMLSGVAELPSLAVTGLEMTLHPRSRQFSARAAVTSDWEIPLGSATAALTGLELDLQRTEVGATAKMAGKGRFAGAEFDVTVDLPDLAITATTVSGTAINLSAMTHALYPTADVAAAVMAPEETIPGEGETDIVPDLMFEDVHVSANVRARTLALRGRSSGTWRLPVGARGLTVEEIRMELNRTPEGGLTGELSGSLQFAGNSLAVRYAFPGDLQMSGRLPEVTLKQVVSDLFSPEQAAALPIPEPLMNLGLQELDFTLNPLAASFTASARAPGFERCGVTVYKSETGKWEFGLAAVTSPSWKFSSLSADLAYLDRVSIPNLALVISSSEEARNSTPGFEAIGDQVTVSRGASLVLARGSSIKLSALVEQLFPDAAGIPALDVTALVIAAEPDAFQLDATIASEWAIPVGKSSVGLTQMRLHAERKDGVTRAEVTGRSRVAGASFEATVTLPELTLSARSAQGEVVNLTAMAEALMPGEFSLPEGVPAFTLTELYLDVNVPKRSFGMGARSAAPWVLPVGATGLHIEEVKLQLIRSEKGKVTGEIGGALKFAENRLALSYKMPGDLVLSGEFPALNLSTLISEVCGAGLIVDLGLPAPLLSLGLEDLKFTLMPLVPSITVAARAPGFDACELIVRRSQDGSWDFAGALVPAESWTFSTLAEELRPLDNLRIPSMALVLSSFDGAEIAFPSIKALGSTLTATRGLHIELPKDRKLSLPALVQQVFPEASGIPKLELSEFDLSVSPQEKRFAVHAQIDNDWAIPVGKSEVSLRQLVLDIKGTADGVTAELLGKADFAGAAVEVSVAVPDLAVTAKNAEGTVVNLTAMVGNLLPPEVTIPSFVPNFAFSDIHLTGNVKERSFAFDAKTAGSWDIPVGVTGLSIHDLRLEVNASKGAKAKTTAEFSGRASLAGAELSVRFALPGEMELKGTLPSIRLSSLLAAVCGEQALQSIQIPPAILEAGLEDLSVAIEPLAPSMAISAKLPGFDLVSITVRKNSEGKWAFAGVLVPASEYHFSSITPALQPLDGLKFSDSALVVSSAGEKAFKIPTQPDSKGIEVVRGLTLAANMDFTGTAAHDILGIERLGVRSALDLSGSVELEGYLGGEFRITDQVAFAGGGFRVAVTTGNVALAIFGDIDVVLDGSPLTFSGTMMINPSGASFAATMQGTWHEPFGAKGISVGDVGLELGINLQRVPIIGLAGEASINEVKGHAQLRVDTANPAACMLAVGFEQLDMGQVVDALCHPSIARQIPQELISVIRGIQFHKADIYIVPQKVRIGQLEYEAGIALEGKMTVEGITSEAKAKVDYKEGLEVHAATDPIDIAGVFSLTGIENQQRPVIHVDVGLSRLPSVRIAGKASLLGISQKTDVEVTGTGLRCELDGKILGLFDSHLAVEAGLKTMGLRAKGTMRNDLFAYIKEHGAQHIQEIHQFNLKNLTKAQEDLRAAQDKVNQLNAEIEKLRSIVQAERQGHQQKLEEAKRNVDGAQAKVNDLLRQIDQARAAVQAERNAHTSKLEAAKHVVAQEQNKVNGLNAQIDQIWRQIENERRGVQDQLSAKQAEVDRAQAEVNRIWNEIESFKRWYYSLPKIDVPWKPNQTREAGFFVAKLGALTAAHGVATGALQTVRLALEAIKRTANLGPIQLDPRVSHLIVARDAATLSLKAAEGVLSGLQGAVNLAPVDLDPRVSSLIAAHQLATKGLEAAKLVLSGLQAASVITPIDIDPRVAGVIALREAATLALQAAHKALEDLKRSLGLAANIGTFIAQHGAHSVIDVRSAQFEADLTALRSRRVRMGADIDVLSRRVHQEFDFDFNNPLESVKSLVQSLLNM